MDRRMGMVRSIKGFTLLEIIIIIVVLGILSISVSTRFFSSSDVASEAAVDQITAAIQYTQVLAMGNLAERYIQFGRDEYQGDGGGCSQGGGGSGGGGSGGGGCSFPGGGGDGNNYYYQICVNSQNCQEKNYLPSGVTVSDATFRFDSLGELKGADAAVSVGGRTITVYKTTGKVANW